MLVERDSLGVCSENMKVESLNLTELLAGEVGYKLIQKQACNPLFPELLANTQGQDVANLGAGPEAAGQ